MTECPKANGTQDHTLHHSPGVPRYIKNIQTSQRGTNEANLMVDSRQRTQFSSKTGLCLPDRPRDKLHIQSMDFHSRQPEATTQKCHPSPTHIHERIRKKFGKGTNAKYKIKQTHKTSRTIHRPNQCRRISFPPFQIPKSMKKIRPTQNQPWISEIDGKPLSILQSRQRTPRKNSGPKRNARQYGRSPHFLYIIAAKTTRGQKDVFSLTEE